MGNVPFYMHHSNVTRNLWCWATTKSDQKHSPYYSVAKYRHYTFARLVCILALSSISVECNLTRC